MRPSDSRFAVAPHCHSLDLHGQFPRGSSPGIAPVCVLTAQSLTSAALKPGNRENNASSVIVDQQPVLMLSMFARYHFSFRRAIPFVAIHRASVVWTLSLLPQRYPVRSEASQFFSQQVSSRRSPEWSVLNLVSTADRGTQSPSTTGKKVKCGVQALRL